MERQRTRLAKKVLKKKNEIGRITITQLKYIYHKAIIIKSVWYWQRALDQEQNKKKKTDPDKYSQRIADKGARGIQWKKDDLP